MKLSDTTIISHQINDLETLIETKIVHVLGGRKAKSNLNFQTRFKVAVQFIHDFYEYFSIMAYSELKIREFEVAKQYIMEWRPNINLKKEIDLINRKGEAL